jgi:hypothetical protein
MEMNRKGLCLALMVLVLALAPTTSVKATNESPYSIGFLAGQNDTKTDRYDSQDACSDSNYSATQTYTCLKGYSDGDASRHHAGYLQGVQGIELKGGHIQQFIKGYFDGLHGYWWNRGLVEGYSGLPMSLHNKNYTDAYKSEAAERAAGYPCTKKAGFDLGFLPAHTNDNYRDFYLGLDQGGDAYDMVDGTHYFLYKPPPGHTSEYRDGWKFGYSLGLVFDADCPSTTTTSPTPQQNGTTTESNKTSISTYQSGYEHGISDAKKVIQGSKDLYILQPGKGWTDHTGQFIQAYVVGLNSTANMPGVGEQDMIMQTMSGVNIMKIIHHIVLNVLFQNHIGSLTFA